MGRPLKIQKTSTGSGNGGAAVSVDIGFPNFGSLTAPVVNTGDTLSDTQYLGVVGGAAPTDTPSATNPRIDVIVNIAAPSGSGIGVATGYIIRQKGAHKYLVGDATGVNDGSFVVGQAYQISTVGTTTNWTAAGAPSNFGLGTVFTATSVGGSGNGAAFSVGVCVLDNDRLVDTINTFFQKRSTWNTTSARKTELVDDVLSQVIAGRVAGQLNVVAGVVIRV